MQTIELPFPVIADNPYSWPEVCLAEVWQPDPTGTRTPRSLPAYRRRLFAAQDWQTIWPKVDRCSLYHYDKRPAVVTRYQTSGTQLTLMLQAIELGLAVPRLYALDGLLRPHQLQRETPSGRLPLSGQSGTWVGRNWNVIRKIWQQQDTDGLRGLGLIEVANDRVMIQPISHDSSCTDRRVWASNAGHASEIAGSCRNDFLNAPLLTEPVLVARAVKPYQSHYRLNRGLLEKLRLQTRKDSLAPRAAISGITPDCSRPHYDRLVVVLAEAGGYTI